MKCLSSLVVLLLVFAGIALEGCHTSTEKRYPVVETALCKEVTNQPLLVKGCLPPWLCGTYVRNGPTHVQIDNQEIPHWFDGLAMLHGFTFRQGQVHYSNKFLRTEAYKDAFEHGNLNYPGFANPPRFSFFQKLKLFLFPGPCPNLANANVNVGKIANNYVAFTEIPYSVRFDHNTMNTLGPLEFCDNLPHQNIFESAHMQFDRRANEKINYLVKYGIQSYYMPYKIDNQIPCRESIAKIKINCPAYMHSFAITERYIILVEFPFVVNPLNLMLSSEPFIKNYVWRPELGTRFFIINRRTGRCVRLLHDKPFFAFHHANAYEKGSKIILDIVTYPNADIIDNVSDLDKLSNCYTNRNLEPLQSKLMRFTLSPFDNCIHSEEVLEGYFEFPRINDYYNAYPYRYLYGADPRPLSHASDTRTLYKIDMKTKQKILWQESGVIPGEPTFIAKPNAKAEDEGVIVSLVLDVPRKSSFLLVLDAKTFTEIARAPTPFSIPIGLHGQYFKN